MRWIYKNPKDFLYIDYLLNPVPLLAVFVMAINDHYLKYEFQGWITGKLSDFCGVFYFPLFLIAGYTLIINLIKYAKIKSGIDVPFYLNQKAIFYGIAITLVFMILVKLFAASNQLIVFLFSKYLFEIKITQDPTDLLAFLVCPFTYYYARSFLSRF